MSEESKREARRNSPSPGVTISQAQDAPGDELSKTISVLVVFWYLVAGASCADSTYPCAIKRSTSPWRSTN
jgi:hypothetical protein